MGVMPHEAQHASMRMWPKLLVHVQRSAVSLGSTLTYLVPRLHTEATRAELVPLTVQLSHHHNGSKPLPVHASCFRKRQAAYE